MSPKIHVHREPQDGTLKEGEVTLDWGGPSTQRLVPLREGQGERQGGRAALMQPPPRIGGAARSFPPPRREPPRGTVVWTSGLHTVREWAPSCQATELVVTSCGSPGHACLAPGGHLTPRKLRPETSNRGGTAPGHSDPPVVPALSPDCSLDTDQFGGSPNRL